MTPLYPLNGVLQGGTQIPLLRGCIHTMGCIPCIPHIPHIGSTTVCTMMYTTITRYCICSDGVTDGVLVAPLSL